MIFKYVYKYALLGGEGGGYLYHIDVALIGVDQTIGNNGFVIFKVFSNRLMTVLFGFLK